MRPEKFRNSDSEKTFGYLKSQEIIQSGNFSEYYICVKEYFDMPFSTLKYISQAQNEINH